MMASMDRYLVSVLRFDAETEEHIQRVMMQIQRSLGRAATEPFAPHISLVPADLDKHADWAGDFHEWLSAQQSFDVTFSHVGVFGGDILFLGATATESLFAFHLECFQRMSPCLHAPWIDLYKPQRWVPHCTLAVGVPEHALGSVIVDATSSLKLPLRAVCQAVDLVSVEGEKPEVIGHVSLLTS
ncbi:2'-5' RNA ligase family protein [Candidatus Bipolaricaulota bacterium]